MKRIIIASLIGLTLGNLTASSQVASNGYRGETVVASNGTPVAPWVQRELCRKSTATCEVAIVNSTSGEVAKMGSILGTDFEFTGNGAEIQRAETAIAKATRLNPPS